MDRKNSSIGQTRNFRAWGLNIASSIDLPEFLPGNEAPPDVLVDYGLVPVSLAEIRSKGVCFQAAPGRFLLNVAGIARFLVVGGKNILIHRFAGAADNAVRLFLQGSAFGALLHQRGILPLHASAIRVNGRAVLFCGVSSVGKSTLAGAFVKRGYPVLTDDICALSCEKKDIPMVLPGFPQLRLWANATQRLQENHTALPRVRQGIEKYGLPLRERFCAESTPLDRIYVLNTTNTDRFDLIPISGLEKFNALLANTYRFRFTEGLGNRPEHFSQCAAVGRYVEVRRVIRPAKGFRLSELMNLIEKDLEA